MFAKRFTIPLRESVRVFQCLPVVQGEKGPYGRFKPHAQCIEPGTGRLLMPDRGRKPRAARTRDIEDPVFGNLSSRA